MKGERVDRCSQNKNQKEIYSKQEHSIIITDTTYYTLTKTLLSLL